MAKKPKIGVTPPMPVNQVDQQNGSKQKLTKLERLARREQAQSIRVAAYGGTFGNAGGGAISNADSAFYSPQLSTDFLELPQSEREKRELFRFWYVTHPIVGAAIDFHCFPPGAPVSMRDGSVKSIEELTVGDEVLNGLGEPTKVLQIFRDEVHGPITRLKVRGVQGVIDCTDNHPFLVYRADRIDCRFPVHGLGACKKGSKSLCAAKKCSGTEFGNPEFVFAKDMRPGDYICSPSMATSSRVLSRSQMRLLGYYAAEGSLSRTRYGKLDRVVFTFHAGEFGTIADEILQLFLEVYGSPGRKRLRTDSESCSVVCYKKSFADFCFNHVGSGSLYKRLSLDIMDSPREDVLEFLGAYWNGDGSLTKNGYVATTVSRQLAHQIHVLATKVGYSPTIHEFRPKPSNGFKSNGTVYRIVIPYRFHAEFSQYANFVKGDYTAKSTREYQIRVGNNTLRRIEKVESVQYDGYVYNVEVKGEGDRKSYLAYGLATHNTDVPMSKIRLSLPKGKDLDRNKRILHFYEQMCKRVRLFQTLYDATHEYWLHGNVFIFCEDHDLTEEITEEMISDVKEEEVGDVDYAGRAKTRIERKKQLKPETERVKAIREHVASNYRGWERLQILPPEQVKLEVFQYTNRAKMELIPSEKDRIVVMKAQEQHDDESARIAEDIPEQIRENLLSGQPIPLNTSPYDDFLCSSFCYHLTHKKSSYDDRGISILERCHLPGTEVTARRGGQVLQIPIEELDPETDEVLGGSGNWRKFDHGTRPVSEVVTELAVEKVLEPIRLTSDHKMSVVLDGVRMDVRAGEVLPGDYVQVAQVELTDSVRSIDLADFVRSMASPPYVGRRSGEESSLSMKVMDETGDEFTVRYSKAETDPRKASYLDKLESVLDWLESLNEPATMSGPEFCERFGFYSSDKTKVRAHLAELGASSKIVRVGNRFMTTFYPLRERQDVDRSRNVTKAFRKTVPLDSDSGYLIGYWLGDGWIRRNFSTLDYGQFGICYSTKSAHSCASAERLKSILDHLGVKWSETKHADPSSMRKIQGYNDIFTRWLAASFGHTKDDKHLPDWIFDSPKEFLFGLLRGLIDSDGCVTVKKTGVVTVQLAMSTKPLMDQVILLMQSLGLPPSVHLHKSRDVRMPNGLITENCKPLWQVAFSDSEAVSALMESGFLAKRVDVRIPKNPGLGRKHKFFDGHLHYRVKSVNSVPYAGPVFSLNVDEDHSFYANRVWHANCLRTLLYQDKLRQAQTSIASRAMTPKRVIWADKMSEPDVENLRDQIDQALIDPDFSIIMNFEVHWDEVGSRDRLLDLGTEYEITNKLLFIGLRITESMLTGESTYSGERIHLDVMNTMYLLYRETLAQFVEDYLFSPVAEKKGFWEEDEYGNRVLLYPKLQFTRLALRDNSELQDFMFNLYNKGSLPISFILELLNIDADETLAQLKRDMFTPNDANFNEFLRTVMTKAGEEALEETDVLDKLATSAGLKMSKKKGDRFSGGEGEK
jgi:intein/homing endonuclease